MRLSAFVSLVLAGACSAVLSCPQYAQAQSQRDERTELRIAVGEQQVMDAEGVRSFSEGTKNVVDVRLTKDNSQFVVVGLRPGRTSLLLMMLDGSEVHYQITVFDPEAKLARKDAVDIQDNIRLDFYFVQLSTTYSHHLGVGWPATLGGGTASAGFDFQTGKLTGATAVFDQILPHLDVAQAEGFAKLLRKAALITTNGTQAKFSGGGELNVPITGGFGGTLKQIHFGSDISVRPVYDKQTGRIELQITADISDLTSDNGTGVPGRSVSTLDTVVNLELGQSIGLAGLSASTEMQTQSGLPGLSQVPILGALFGSNTRTTAETENVVFIVPTVVDSMSSRQRSVVDEALAEYTRFSGNLESVHLLPKASRPSPAAAQTE